jgi:hypothetical protein
VIKELLIGKNAEERAKIKSEAIKNEILTHFIGKHFEFQRNNKKIRIEQVEIGIMKKKGIFENAKIGAAPIWFKISVDGKYLNGDGWYGFVNPPVMVPDGTQREVTDELTKEKTFVDNFVENVWEATKEMISQVVMK